MENMEKSDCRTLCSGRKKHFFVLLLIVQGNNQPKPDFCCLLTLCIRHRLDRPNLNIKIAIKVDLGQDM